MKKIVCLHAGPGAGKTTTLFGLAYKLKLKGYQTEINPEYVKDWAWNAQTPKPGDQTYIFAKQSKKERLYMDCGLDFIITDSPLLLTHYYGMKYDWFEREYNTSKMMLQHHHGYCKEKGYSVEHYLIERTKAYSESGRYQTEKEVKKIDEEIQQLLLDHNIKYLPVKGDIHCVDTILEDLLS